MLLSKHPRDSIFISYRREDSAEETERLRRNLEARFPRESIFPEAPTLPMADFKRHAEAALRTCRVLLVVIGPSWLDLMSKGRLHQQAEVSDWVQFEIKRALSRQDIVIIPVLVRGARMPKEDDLPCSIRELGRFEAVEIRVDLDFEGDMDRLARAVKAGLEGRAFSWRQLGRKWRDRFEALLGYPILHERGPPPSAMELPPSERSRGHLSQFWEWLSKMVSKSLKRPEIVEAANTRLPDFETVTEPPERGVDAVLLDEATKAPLPVDHTLAMGMKLLLRVRIGGRLPGSQMRERPPPLDPLLPATEAEFHELSVIVFAKDFTLLSEAEQKVRLPVGEGDSEVAEFRLAAPEIWMQRAELRFGVYYGNQLLQAFHVRALVESKSHQVLGDPIIEIGCDFSQTTRFAGLETFQPRLISLALNDDATGSHTLMIKGSQVKESLFFPDEKLKDANDAARAALQRAVNSGGAVPNFMFDSKSFAMAGKNPAVFSATIRALADIGWQLFTEVFHGSSDGMQRLLQKLRQTQGETLQIAMLHGDHALFPWPLVYDFEPGKDASRICLGDAQCTCGTEPAGYCLRGFWGMRHRVEQLATVRGGTRGAPAVISSAPLAVRTSLLPVVTDAFVRGGASCLKQMLAAKFSELPGTKALLQDLRLAAGRPEILAVICHGKQEAGPVWSKTVLMANSEAPQVDAGAIAAEMLRAGAPWQEPHSLLLLLACGIGAERLDTATGVARAFLNLGAGGVVATECVVDTGLICRFARDLIHHLHTDGLPMGEAMRRTGHGLALEGCPLGFVFTYLGSADLALPT